MPLEMDRQVTVSVTFRTETRNLGVFDTKEGGGVTADGTKHRRGGLGPEKAYGGAPSVQDVTLTRDYDLARDHANARWLMGKVGRARITIVDQFLDEFGVAFGEPFVYTGKLTGATPPNHDSDSSDLGFFELQASLDGDVG
jgi:hypothetical protein